MTKVLNFGSINIDHVYKLPHFVRPGETLTCNEFFLTPGGKGANQSMALALSGIEVFHAGRIGKDGIHVKNLLEESGVDTRFIEIDENEATGHAVIQLNTYKENAIFIYPGANRLQDESRFESVISYFNPGDILLLQNEINGINKLIELGKKNGMIVCLNPAPMDSHLRNTRLDEVDLLILNEVEAEDLTQETRYEEMLETLREEYPHMEILITMGEEGVYYEGESEVYLPAIQTQVIDTTAAGDAFIGYFLASRIHNKGIEESLTTAIKAASLCIQKTGALRSIPTWEEVIAY